MLLRLQSKYYRTIVLPKQNIITIIIITDQWCPDGERARALILVPSRVSPGFMSLRPGAECGSARLDSNSPSLLHPPFPYYHTHSSSSHSHIRIDKQTWIRINTERERHTYTLRHTQLIHTEHHSLPPKARDHWTIGDPLSKEQQTIRGPDTGEVQRIGHQVPYRGGTEGRASDRSQCSNAE